MSRLASLLGFPTWGGRTIAPAAGPADPRSATPSAQRDQWIAEEQWLSGFPSGCSDRTGWLWWQGPATP